MEKLRECPFCGARAELISNDETTYGFPTPKWAVRCEIETCIAHDISPNYSQHEDAIKDWNTRADKWISVEERLPETNEDVLVVVDYGGKSGVITGYMRSQNLGWQGLVGQRLTDVTHWMPLPEPPKGDEN